MHEITAPASFKSILAVLVLSLRVAAVGADEGKLNFNRDVRQILSDKCFHCHGLDAKKREADLRLDIRDSAVGAQDIVPGDPAQSELISRILSDDPDLRMPPAGLSSSITRTGTTSADRTTLSRFVE